MLKQNINIVGIPVLYNIFKEIEQNLSFKVYNFDTNEKYLQFCSEKKLNIKNFIVITKIENRNFFQNKKDFILDNFFFLSEKNYELDFKINFFKFPIDIYILIEKINIQLIKIKYNFQSKIKVKSYLLDINSRIISNRDKSLKLTEREMDIILFLVENKEAKKIVDLQNKVWGYSSELETHTVETHIYRLRKKISDTFNDKKFIISSDEGYFI